MDLTPEAIMSVLTEEGGKVKNSVILSKFQNVLNCSDPVEKKQNRDNFKILVNNVAVVKELEDGKYVVLKKKYHHLLIRNENKESDKERCNAKYGPTSEDAAEGLDKVQECSSFFQHGDNVSDCGSAEDSVDSNTGGNISPCRIDGDSPVRLALQRSQAFDFKPKKCLSFVKNQVNSLNESSSRGQEVFPVLTATANTHKPCALPLRVPTTHTTESQSIKFTEDTGTQEGTADSVPNTPRNKRPSAEGVVLSSPLLRRGCKNARPAEEPKHSILVPLERNEHELLVKSAAGQWDQVYGLLLFDAHLAEKRDFTSGFTALHWAVKCGNSNMVNKIIQMSRKVGGGVDVNAKTHGGYTPLHIAAIHDQEFIMAQLVQDYKADTRIRDNYGKRPYHYLHKGISDAVRELLGEPKTVRPVVAVAPEREEVELHKGHSTLTLTRLFQPHVLSPKKVKPRQREIMYSVTEEPLDE